MTERIDVARRDFLKLGVATGGALLVGVHVAACGRDKTAPVANPTDQPLLAPNAWIRIGKDDSVTLMVASSEMGQGVMTAIPMLLAEELDADWARVRAEFAPAHTDYANPIIGRQHTGGSTAVRGFWQPLREAGAVVRELLIETAAAHWNVPPSECGTEPGVVVHKSSDRRLRYGQLVEGAARRKLPESAFLKDPATFRYIGKSLRRLDTPAKVNGSALFGQDIKVDSLLTAVIARSPVPGGKVKSFDAGAAKKVNGVRHVTRIDAGVAVVADHTWAALRGRDVLNIEWDAGAHAGVTSEALHKAFVAAIPDAKPVRGDGDVAQALQHAKTRVEAEYEVPFLTHACMEPMNCTAHVRANSVEVWAPTQAQATSQRQAARASGVDQDKVRIHTTFLGGGFGRRTEFDFVIEAVQVSKAVGAPVKVMWTREDDMRHGRYRPATFNRLAGGVDDKGNIVAWKYAGAGPSVIARFSEEVAKSGVDRGAVPMVPYAIPNVSLAFAIVNTPLTVGFWRSVNASQNVYITECFFDELARAAGKDPYRARRALLEDNPRLRAVLDLAAQKAGWDSPPAQGRARGIAVCEEFASRVAQVAEVSIENGRVRVHRVVCAIDCGTVVNPDIVAAQMESSVVFGLTAALYGEITLEDGKVKQGNFDDYPLLRSDEAPRVEVHIVPSAEPPGGVGEPGVPPIAPAVANAIFALTGKPVRRLPIRLTGAA
jgi:isoquinoline 1-oxidoreductase beta subunit